MCIAIGDIVERVKKVSYPQDRVAALCLASISGVILFGLTAAWPSPTHDELFHFHRIRALVDALRVGVILPRWFPDFAFGYGYPALNYYSPGFYYPPALLHLAGLDMVLSVRLCLTMGFAFSAWWMFHLLRLYVSLWPAIVSVICFQFFPYRMIDLFVRGAFPEFIAFMWLPLIVYYTIQAVAVHRRAEMMTGEGRSLLAKAGLSWAGLIVTHNLVALMAVLVFGVALALITLLQHSARAGVHRIPAIAVATLGIGILLSAWYTLPALLEISWVIIGHGRSVEGYLNHFVGWTELIDFDSIYTYSYPRSAYTYSLPIYTVPIGVAASIAAVAMQTRALRVCTLVALLLTLGAVWLTTDASAWLWTSSEILLAKLRFPWRWQIFVAFGAALLLAASVESLRRIRRLPAFTVPLLVIILSAYLLAYALVQLDYPVDDTSYQDISVASLWQWDSQSGSGVWGPEFLPIWMTEQYWAIGREPWEPTPILDAIDSVAVAPTRAGLLQQQFQVSAQRAFRLIFHQFYIPAWRVTVDGVQVNTQPATNLGLISVMIPPGAHTVTLAWGATRAVWFGRALTAIGWVVAFALLSRAVKGTSILRQAGAMSLVVVWFAAGALMVVAASAITARAWDLSAIGAEYGSIRLEGVQTPSPTRAGDVAPVELTWLVKGPGEPVSAFVHLVDDAGVGIAQHDGPPGGAYTPYGRWTPGLIIHSTHNITIPASLPPGNYRLIAGLYYPDISHEPLMPMNADSPRIDIGMVEVLP